MTFVPYERTYHNYRVASLLKIPVFPKKYENLQRKEKKRDTEKLFKLSFQSFQAHSLKLYRASSLKTDIRKIFLRVWLFVKGRFPLEGSVTSLKK